MPWLPQTQQNMFYPQNSKIFFCKNVYTQSFIYELRVFINILKILIFFSVQFFIWCWKWRKFSTPDLTKWTQRKEAVFSVCRTGQDYIKVVEVLFFNFSQKFISQRGMGPLKVDVNYTMYFCPFWISSSLKIIIFLLHKIKHELWII